VRLGLASPVVADVVGPVWINGRLVAPMDATVRATDHGLIVGNGVFESIKVVAGAPFALSRHLARLHASAHRLGIQVSVPDTELRAAAGAVIAAGGVRTGKLRITVTGGPGPLGSGRPDGPATVVIALGPATAWPPTAAVAVCPWTRNPSDPLAGAKTTSYGGNVVALAWAAHQDPPADEALFTVAGTGALSEGTGSNVFVAVQGALHTPSLATACLAGVTRALVIEAIGNVVERDDLHVNELRHAEEAFLTSATRGVQPIAVVDGAVLAAAPGPLTKAAAAAYAALVASTSDP
jgi:branched-chain amino acid aminotransferase